MNTSKIALRTGASALRLITGTTVLSLGLMLAGCGGVPTNRSMNSVHQPVVEKVNYSLDVGTDGSGLVYGEQSRLAGWFEAMGIKYGDRVFVDDPGANPSTRSAVEAVASRYGILLSEGAPATDSYVPQGKARVVLVRSKATVSGCPNWSSNSDFNPNNGLSGNYGCATNSNIAAMVANPEDLLHGATNDTGVSARSAKAIEAYRAAEPSGKGGTQLPATSSKGD